MIRTLWQIDPAIAVYLTERFKLNVIRSEVTKLVRSSTADVLDVPEALNFLLGEGVELAAVRRDLKAGAFALSPGRLSNLVIHVVASFVGTCATRDRQHIF